MKVYIVVRNDIIEIVFPSQEQAQAHIDSVKGWNIWKIVEMEVEGTLI